MGAGKVAWPYQISSAGPKPLRARSVTPGEAVAADRAGRVIGGTRDPRINRKEEFQSQEAGCHRSLSANLKLSRIPADAKIPPSYSPISTSIRGQAP